MEKKYRGKKDLIVHSNSEGFNLLQDAFTQNKTKSGSGGGINNRVDNLYYNGVRAHQEDYSVFKVTFKDDVLREFEARPGASKIKKNLSTSIPKEIFLEWKLFKADVGFTNNVDISLGIGNRNSSSTSIEGSINNRAEIYSEGAGNSKGVYLTTPVIIVVRARAISKNVIVKVRRGMFGQLRWKKVEINYTPKQGETPGIKKDKQWK